MKVASVVVNRIFAYSVLAVIFCAGSGWASSVINTAAGRGFPQQPQEILDRDVGDNGPATDAALSFPRGVAVDSAGNIYIADTENSRIRRVDAGTGVITTVAGTENGGPSDDVITGDATATANTIGRPFYLVVDAAGNIYFSETDHHRVRKVDAATGFLSTVAGQQDANDTATGAATGDGGAATSALLSGPRGLALDGSGNLYIAETAKSRVRKVDAGGIITTVAGIGTAGFSGDGAAATLAQLASPIGVAVDGSGNLYIADSSNHRIRKVDGGGVITTVAGDGTARFAGDGGAGTAAALNAPKGLTVDASGALLIADFSNHRIRSLDLAGGTITTLAGGGTLGDGAAPLSTLLIRPSDVAADAGGNVFIAEPSTHSVRQCMSGSVTNVEDTDGDGFSNSIEAAAGTSTTDASDTPFSGLPAQADVPPIDRLKVRLKFGKVNKDALILKGTLTVPVGTNLASQSITIDIGGVSRTFTSTATGKFTGATANDRLKMKLLRNGVTVKFSARFRNGDFQTLLSDENLTNSVIVKSTRVIKVVLLFNNTIYGEHVGIGYRNGSGKGSGTDFSGI